MVSFGSLGDFNNDLGDNSESGRIFAPWHLFESNSNNGPIPRPIQYWSDGRYSCSGVPPPMVSWWVQYLAKGPRPDFNNCPWDDLNSGRILAHQRLFESNLNNGLSPSQSNLGTLKKITAACTVATLLISPFSPPKCYEASFK